MLDESTAMYRRVVIHARFDDMENVARLTGQATEVMQTAMDCALEAPKGKPSAQADWQRAMEDWRSQHAVAQAIVLAKQP